MWEWRLPEPSVRAGWRSGVEGEERGSRRGSVSESF